jgi:hypothetical protein
LDEDSKIKIDKIICRLAHFYKGAASFDWLESQPISKLIYLNKQAQQINKEMQPK